jgi:hypothetical protein
MKQNNTFIVSYTKHRKGGWQCVLNLVGAIKIVFYWSGEIY